MTTHFSYEEKISRYRWNRLLSLWASIKKENTPGWEPGKAFEYLVLRAFELEGAEVRWPYTVIIGEDDVEQIDGAVYSDGLSCLVECKDSVKRTNVEPIAKLRNQLLRRPGTALGIVFSRSGFTDSAATLARFTAPQTIILWDGAEVAYALQKKCMRRALVAKYRYCIEHGLPDYNIIISKL